MKAMKRAGIHVVNSPAEIGITMSEALKNNSATKKKVVKKAAPKKKSIKK